MAAFPVLVRRVLFKSHLFAIARRTWVIRIEPTFGGPRQLLCYLGAYVNRVAISPQRVTAHDAATGTVTYTWTTNAQPNLPQQATLSAVEFLACFAQYILPVRFQHIRFRGLWPTAHGSTPGRPPSRSGTRGQGSPRTAAVRTCAARRRRRRPGRPCHALPLLPPWPLPPPARHGDPNTTRTKAPGPAGAVPGTPAHICGGHPLRMNP